MNKKIQKKLTWLLLFSVINWVFYPSEAYASRSDQGSNTHSFSVADNQYKYSSYYLDSESGMYYLKARYYSPELMRFFTRDTYDLSNKYAYCDGNPIEKVDPSGHISENWWHYTLDSGLIVLGVGFSVATAGTTLFGVHSIIQSILGSASLGLRFTKDMGSNDSKENKTLETVANCVESVDGLLGFMGLGLAWDAVYGEIKGAKIINDYKRIYSAGDMVGKTYVARHGKHTMIEHLLKYDGRNRKMEIIRFHATSKFDNNSLICNALKKRYFGDKFYIAEDSVILSEFDGARYYNKVMAEIKGSEETGSVVKDGVIENTGLKQLEDAFMRTTTGWNKDNVQPSTLGYNCKRFVSDMVQELK